MVLTFSEEELRKWYRENVDSKFLCCEGDFLRVVKEVSSNTASNVKKHSIPAGDWLYWTHPPAQLQVGNCNIQVEKFTLELVRAILCSGGIDFILGGASSIATILVNVFYFATHAGQYVSKLPEADCDFYKYLTTTYYTYSDRLDDVFVSRKRKGGFSLDDAIDQYCQLQIEKDPSENMDVCRLKATTSAEHLRELKILDKRENGNFYISF